MLFYCLWTCNAELRPSPTLCPQTSGPMKRRATRDVAIVFFFQNQLATAMVGVLLFFVFNPPNAKARWDQLPLKMTLVNSFTSRGSFVIKLTVIANLRQGLRVVPCSLLIHSSNGVVMVKFLFFFFFLRGGQICL